MERYFRYSSAEYIPGYDCRMSRKSGTTNYILGAIFILFGIIVQIAYFLEFLVMAGKQNRRLSCYKIMISLGLYDMGSMWINSMLTGYFWITGANYCTNPNLIYITGSLALAFWCASCMNCFILVIFRILELCNKPLMELLFMESRTYLVLIIPFLYGLYFCLYTKPLLFNSDHQSWFFFTFMQNHRMEEYFNYSQTVNNILVVAVTCLLYLQYFRILLQFSKLSSGLSWTQRSVFLQCASICLINLLYASISVYSNIVPTPSYFVYISHLCWQLGNAFPAFVYLVLNRTIRKEVFALLRFRKELLQTKVIQSSRTTPFFHKT
ncbi:unnamed protein product [Cylicocyclus nassatus]|uniref:Uncharacterized protein n=1 Tax=Cylicocyclus nassatus TaxID=53992 RepID=A0AA36GEG1_CYLNA|nr:unnamed protein product [Cylicocyclus nassatus]